MPLAQIKFYASIIALVLFLGTIGYFVYDYKSLKSENVELQASLMSLSKSIEAQNKGIEDLKKLSEEQTKNINAAIENSNKVREEYDREILRIARQKVPKDCEGAMNWLKMSRGDLQWKK